MTAHPDFSATAVYDGRTYIGAVASRSRGIFRAVDATGRALGTYATLTAARDAVLAAAHVEAEAAP